MNLIYDIILLAFIIDVLLHVMAAYMLMLENFLNIIRYGEGFCNKAIIKSIIHAFISLAIIVIMVNFFKR